MNDNLYKWVLLMGPKFGFSGPSYIPFDAII